MGTESRCRLCRAPPGGQRHAFITQVWPELPSPTSQSVRKQGHQPKEQHVGLRVCEIVRRKITLQTLRCSFPGEAVATLQRSCDEAAAAGQRAPGYDRLSGRPAEAPGTR